MSSALFPLVAVVVHSLCALSATCSIDNRTSGRCLCYVCIYVGAIASQPSRNTHYPPHSNPSQKPVCLLIPLDCLPSQGLERRNTTTTKLSIARYASSRAGRASTPLHTMPHSSQLPRPPHTSLCLFIAPAGFSSPFVIFYTFFFPSCSRFCAPFRGLEIVTPQCAPAAAAAALPLAHSSPDTQSINRSTHSPRTASPASLPPRGESPTHLTPPKNKLEHAEESTNVLQHV